MPTLGQTLRASRLGYHWSKKHQCMIYISGDGSFTVRLCPADQLPRSGHKEMHRCWWDTPEILAECPVLSRIKAVRQPISLTIGDDGELLQ
jgi:hypothetical protein